jgi:hypothetical protein
MTIDNKGSAYKVCKCGVLVALSAMIFFPVLGQSATYYDASSRTAVFALTPGAKIGPSAIRNNAMQRSVTANPVRLTTAKNLVSIALSFARRSPVDITVYDVAGKRAFRQRGFSGSFLRIDTHLFAPGLYSVIVRYSGQNYSRNFTVSR